MNKLLGLVLALWTLPALAEDVYLTPYDQPYPAIYKELHKAKKSILVGAYGLNDPGFINELVQASKRGVKVQLVVDSTQASLAHQKVALASLKKAKIYTHVGQSARHRIMHVKFFVVDDKVVGSGSLNFTVGADLQDNSEVISDSPEQVKRFTDYWHKVDTDMPLPKVKKSK